MDKSTHEIRTEYWKEIVRQCQARPTGQTTKEWLRAKGISNKSYYYWLRKFRKAEYDELKTNQSSDEDGGVPVSFAELPAPYSSYTEPAEDSFKPDIIIKNGSMSIEVANSSSPELLSVILKAVSYAC